MPLFSSPCLPPGFQLEWKENSSLLTVYNGARDYAESVQGFWNEMECIDKEAWILYAQKPSLGETKRRVAISLSLSFLSLWDGSQITLTLGGFSRPPPPIVRFFVHPPGINVICESSLGEM